VSERELTDAVAELYRVFARYPLRDDVSFCDHCIAPEDVAALHAVPLPEAPVDKLGRLLMNHSTWGDREYHLHFLPRLLELVSSGAMNSYSYSIWLPPFLLPCREGPADEHRALDDFFTAWWRATITTWPARCQPQEILQLVQSCGQPVAPYLAAWGSYGGPAAVDHLEALVTDLTTGSITDVEIRHDIDAWICGPIPEAVLTNADAEEALEDLRWFREWYCAPR
jgi:hypothetical protein